MGAFDRYVQAFLSALGFHFRRFAGEYLTILVCLILGFGLLYAFIFAPPANFPRGEIFVIAPGSSLPKISEALAEEHLIAHPGIFSILMRIFGNPKAIVSGPYLFKNPENALTIAWRISHANFGIAPVKMTFPEGSTVLKMSAIIDHQLPLLDANAFALDAAAYQGFLFPDTYYIFPAQTADDVISLLRNTFAEKVAPIMPELSASGHSLRDLVIMASIIEGEAKTPADRRIVSGILWKRLSLSMPLQVDAAPDTYQHTGLPSAPINNPGLNSLVASAEPATSSYLYYLSDRMGVMHYANTFAEQLANERRYLP